MRKLSLSLFVAFALCTAAAVAQAGGSQGTQGSSPGMSQPGQQPGTAQPGETPGGSVGQPDQTANPNQNKAEKGEKKLKGCVQSQGGQYVLETKKGKAVALTGQDVSAHVGHEVSVKGTWESGGGGMSPSSSSSGSASGSEKTFNVASVDMISDTCKSGKEKGSSGSMGASPSGTGSSTGAGTGNTGNTTQPPQ
jgi:hypothetical protein